MTNAPHDTTDEQRRAMASRAEGFHQLAEAADRVRRDHAHVRADHALGAFARVDVDVR